MTEREFVSNDLPVIQIVYTDARNRETERHVHPYRFSGGAMYARCHLRNATRSFLVPRIGQVLCLATGAVYDDLFAWLQDTLNADDLAAVRPHVDGTVTTRPHTGGRRRRAAGEDAISVEDLLDYLIAAASVLYWLADADGEIAGEEALMIEDFLFGTADALGLALDAGHLLDVASRALGMVMDNEDMRDALEHIVPAPQLLREQFWIATGRVLNADGVQRPEEVAAWRTLQDAWESLT